MQKQDVLGSQMSEKLMQVLYVSHFSSNSVTGF